LRYSKYLAPTLKEVPAEAEIVSHKLMLRAGMIRKLAAGVYSLLPLGVRVVRKVEAIIREEMNKAGALEVSLPSIQPAELWEESGRWNMYGKELLRITDRHGREFCYGPTHEEVITDLVRRELRSYRDLPVNLYQIQTKFRDEIRPRFGLMRAREFSMKDAYSFDTDDEAAGRSYALMKNAYNSIFKRCGLRFRAVEADTGQIGGSFSHEFMVLAESGEDLIAYCHQCDYAANVEKVSLVADDTDPSTDSSNPVEKVLTPGKGSIDKVSEFLNRAPSTFIKTLIYKTDNENNPLVAALCRGDHEINHTKLARALGVNEVVLADEDEVKRATGAPIGYAGAMGLAIPVMADNAVRSMQNAVTGANEADTHIINVNPGRDFPDARYADIRQPVEGDRCPKCGPGRLRLARGIEVGHIFKLGSKYSESLGATFLDRQGAEKHMIMGCYGIGVARTAAAAIEQNHDEQGIVWPVSIAPFDISILPLNIDDHQVVSTAEKLYDDMIKSGAEVLLDDREARPGVKFKDADLIGAPLQVIVGKKGLANGAVEIKIRKTGEKISVPVDEAASKAVSILPGL